MAAPGVKMVGVCDEDSSSSDDEELRRCQEAVWEARGDRNKDVDTCVQQSKRVVVAKHEHDGNELQVTEGFRTHVAKKLGSLLDSCITESRTEPSSCVESATRDDDDDGFRLFSTSVPGQAAEDPPAPPRRRPAPSSSDSDSEMEMRLREAVVSVTDLLPSHSSTLSEPPRIKEPTKKEKKKKVSEEDEENAVVKKKKKRKQSNKETMDCAASPVNTQSNGDHHQSSEQQHVKRKKKKKKKKDGSAEEENLD